MIKSILDRLVAVLLLLLLIIPCLIAGVINSLIDRDSIFFTQPRIGKDGKIFNLYKLRTMSQGKITPFGKFLRRWSLDELPQLWNVVIGNMSIVGPRPLLVEYQRFYSVRQNRRHEVLPGITGWSQVHGRNALDWNQRFELDVFYVENQSLYLDLKVLLKTMVQLADKKSADYHFNNLPKFSEQHH